MRSMIAPNLPGIGISEAPRFGLVAASLPRDHVGRHRPRASGKADQGLAGLEPFAHHAHSLVDRIKTRWDERCSSSSARSTSVGVSRGPSPATNVRFCPSANGTMRMSEKRIAASSFGKALQRLKRDLGRRFADRRRDRGSRPSPAEAAGTREGSGQPAASSTSARGSRRSPLSTASKGLSAGVFGRSEGIEATLFSLLYIYRIRLML